MASNSNSATEAIVAVSSLLPRIDMTRLLNIQSDIFPHRAKVARIPAQVQYREYLRFLAIKIVCTDLSPLELRPSYPIEEIWRSHAIDTTAYFPLVQTYTGRLMYDPNPPMMDSRLQRTRLGNTHRKYRELFNEDPLRPETKELWSDEEAIDPVKLPMKLLIHLTAANVPMLGAGRIEIDGNDTLAKLQEKIRTATSIPVNEQRLYHKGCPLLDPTKRLVDYNIVSLDTIHLTW